jgi:hypothetical protein
MLKCLERYRRQKIKWIIQQDRLLRPHPLILRQLKKRLQPLRIEIHPAPDHVINHHNNRREIQTRKRRASREITRARSCKDESTLFLAPARGELEKANYEERYRDEAEDHRWL